MQHPLSPTRFSHSVHNAQAGLFSIAAGNRQASSSIAAEAETFGCAYLEALTFLERFPEAPVLLVMADVPLAPVFAALVDEPAASYGLALLLASDGPGTPARLRDQRRRRRPQPRALARCASSSCAGSTPPEPRLALGSRPAPLRVGEGARAAKPRCSATCAAQAIRIRARSCSPSAWVIRNSVTLRLYQPVVASPVKMPATWRAAWRSISRPSGRCFASSRIRKSAKKRPS